MFFRRVTRAAVIFPPRSWQLPRFRQCDIEHTQREGLPRCRRAGWRYVKRRYAHAAERAAAFR